jgi:opacity protein-like surface antigen
MRIKAAVLALALSLFCIPALAQLNSRSEVSADFTGNFQKQAAGFGITDSPSYSGGFLLNYRYHFDNWSAIEVNYAHTNFTQYYSSGDQTQSNANEVTLAYVNTFGVSRHARFRPFVEAGTGGLIFSPIESGSFSAPLTQDRMAFLYGAGVDWRAIHHVSVRLGYRGLIYKAPDFALGDQTTNAMTQMAEPYVGLAFRF